MKLKNYSLIIAVILLAQTLAQPSLVYGITLNFAILKKPVGLAWANGEILASYRDNTTRLVKISIDGKTIEPFAPSFSGEGEVYLAVSPGKASFQKGYLYVSSGNSIYEINPAGTEVKLFSKPFEAMGLGYLAFDTVGTWGYDLYAVNFNGLLWRVDSSGKATLILDLGNDLLPESIAFAPESFGDYGGDLIIALEMGRKVIAISKDNPTKVTVLLEFPDESPERVLTVPSDSDLLIAKYDEDRIVVIPAENFSDYKDDLVIITEGEAGENGSITVIQANRELIILTKLFENIKNPHFEGAVFIPTNTDKIMLFPPITSILTITVVISVLAFLAVMLFAKRKKERMKNTESSSTLKLQ